MRLFIKFIFALFLMILSFYSHCQAIEVEQFVDRYSKATDVQKEEILKQNIDKAITVSGVVCNVEQWDTFDERADTRGRYYKVVICPQKTKQKNPYEVLIFFKNLDSVKSIDEGQQIKMDGTLLKIIDQRLLVSVWVFGENLTPKDKVMFQKGSDPGL